MSAYVCLPGVCVACGQHVEDKPRHTVTCAAMAVALDREYWPYDSEQSAHFAQLKKGGIAKARKKGTWHTRTNSHFRKYARQRAAAASGSAAAHLQPFAAQAGR